MELSSVQAQSATLAYKLASSEKRILLLEHGDFLRREKENWDAIVVFAKNKYSNGSVRCKSFRHLLESLLGKPKMVQSIFRHKVTLDMTTKASKPVSSQCGIFDPNEFTKIWTAGGRSCGKYFPSMSRIRLFLSPKLSRSNRELTAFEKAC
jgi:hypothetical protein